MRTFLALVKSIWVFVSFLLLHQPQQVFASEEIESHDGDYSLTIRALDPDFSDESSKEKPPITLRFGSYPSVSTESLEEMIYNDPLSHAAVISAASHINSSYPYLRPDGLVHLICLFKITHLPDYTTPTLIRALYQTIYDVSEVFNEENIDYTLCQKTLLGFGRNKSLCKWHKRLCFAVNAESEETLQKSQALLKNRGYNLSVEEVDIYKIHSTEKLRFKASWENEEFIVPPDYLLVTIKIYHKGTSGMEFCGDRITKDDFVSQKAWDEKSLQQFEGFKGNIQVWVINGMEEYLSARYGVDWKTHETYKNIRRKLTEAELEIARPSGPLKLTKHSSSFSCNLL